MRRDEEMCQVFFFLQITSICCDFLRPWRENCVDRRTNVAISQAQEKSWKKLWCCPKTTQKFNQVYSSRTTYLVLITDYPTLRARFWRCHQLAALPLLDHLHKERRALIALELSNSSSPISMRFLEEKRRMNFFRRLSEGFIENDGLHADELLSLIQLAAMKASVIFAW